MYFCVLMLKETIPFIVYTHIHSFQEATYFVLWKVANKHFGEIVCPTILKTKRFSPYLRVAGNHYKFKWNITTKHALESISLSCKEETSLSLQT